MEGDKKANTSHFVGFNIIITLILLIRRKREERSIPVTSSETFKDIYFERVRQGFSFLYPSLLSSSAVEKGRQNPGIGLGINLSLDDMSSFGHPMFVMEPGNGLGSFGGI
ncbi:hypothetical protein NC651_018175 [Populus alba x Populus x berolinensis]|nr:hypothetical protein NC651_018175 [Populus alba x Populus x berolinensis]